MPEKDIKRKPRKEGAEELVDPTDALLGMAVQLTKQAAGTAILACVEASLLPSLQEWVGKAPLLVATNARNLPEDFKGALKGVIELPAIRLPRLGQIKLAIVLGMAQGLITPTDTLVCLAGPPNAHRLDTLLLLTVREEFELFAGSDRLLVEHVNPEVFEQVLEIAIQIAAEGREGKPIGALFVVGDYENVARYATQLVLNPLAWRKRQARKGWTPLGIGWTLKASATPLSGCPFVGERTRRLLKRACERYPKKPKRLKPSAAMPASLTSRRQYLATLRNFGR